MSLISHFPLKGSLSNREGSYGATQTDVTWVTGIIGEAAAFNGTTSKIVIDSGILKHLRQTFSIALWFMYSENETDVGYLFCNNDNGGSTDTSFSIYVSTNRRIRVLLNGVPYESTVTVTPGQPHHATLSMGSEGVDVYLDGEKIIELPSQGLLFSKPNLQLGSRAGTTSYVLEGWISDVRFYDHKLSAFEVWYLSKAPVAHFTLNDNSLGMVDKVGQAPTLFNVGGLATPISDSPVNGGAMSFSGVVSQRLESIGTTLKGEYWTISTWVMKRAHDVERYPIFLSFGLPYIACDDWGDTQIRCSYSNSEGLQTNVIGTTQPELNKWYHVVAVADMDGVHIYVNGSHENTNPLRARAMGDGGRDMFIGRHNGGQHYHIDGAVSDVRVFNRPFNSKEVEWLYRGRLTIDNLGGLFANRFVKDNVIIASNYNRHPAASEITINKDEVITNHSSMSSEYVQQVAGSHNPLWNLEYDILVDEPGDYVVQSLLINENGTGRGVGMAIDDMTTNDWRGQVSRFDFTWATCETYTLSKGRHIFKMCPGLEVKVKAIRFVGPGNVVHVNPNVRQDGIVYGLSNSQGPSRGLIGHWRLGGDYRDLSMSGNDGEESSVLPLSTGPRYPSSVIGYGDHVKVPGIKPGMMSKFTWSVWVKTTNSPAYLIMGSRNGNNTDISMAIDNGVLCIHKYTLDGMSDSNHAIGSTRVDDGQWHLLTVSYDNGQMVSYVDGVREGESFHVNSRTIGRELSFNYNTYVGGTFTHRMFDGEMSDARVYEVSLTDGEVKALYETTRSKSNNPVILTESGRVVRGDVDSVTSQRSSEQDMGFAANKILDRSVGGNHAVAPQPENMPGISVDSDGNPFLKFNGTSNYLTIPSGSTPNLHQNNNGITIETWLKGDENGDLGGAWAAINRYRQFAIGGKAGMIKSIFQPDGYNNDTPMWYPKEYNSLDFNTGDIDYREWHHFAAVWDKESLTIKMYVDGKLVFEDAGMSSIADHHGTIYIGIRDVSAYTGQYFNGCLREIRIWDVARTEDEIRQNYQKTLTGGEPGLVCYITP